MVCAVGGGDERSGGRGGRRGRGRGRGWRGRGGRHAATQAGGGGRATAGLRLLLTAVAQPGIVLLKAYTKIFPASIAVCYTIV